MIMLIMFTQAVGFNGRDIFFPFLSFLKRKRNVFNMPLSFFFLESTDHTNYTTFT